MTEAANADQAKVWNTGAGETWAALQERLDQQLEPLGRVAMSALAPRSGEHILDIGCGAGQTSHQLGTATGRTGSVLGVDISRTLLDVAEARPASPGVAFKEADAQTYPFDAGTFDAAFSRFGVMFFADPVAAFTNIARALKSSGRLSFVCWRAPAENVFMSLPMAVAAPLLPPTPPGPPSTQGPFAFADPDHVRNILTTAGFKDIDITPHDQKIGSGDLEQTLTLALKVGPLGALLRENPDQQGPVVDAVRAALAEHEGPEGVKLASATWIVTARAP